MRIRVFPSKPVMMVITILATMMSLTHAGYKFYQYQDAGYGDMLKLENRSVEELKAFCDLTPSCLGFNTDGHIKILLHAMNKAYFQPSQGLYVKEVASTPAPHLEGYTFHQGKAIYGYDIIKLLKKSVYDLKDFCDNHVACVGFSTDGWMKRSLPSEDQWFRWSVQPEEGVYEKDEPTEIAAELQGYSFLKGQDYKVESYGNVDEEQLAILLSGKSLSELKIFCDNLPDCVGFNTNGYIASGKNVVIRASPEFTNAVEGFYKKQQKEASTKTAYVFHKGKTFDGFNLIQLPEKTFEELKAYCDRLPTCLAFDSLGNIKYGVPDSNKWHTWTTNSGKGLFVKRETA